MTAWTCYIDGHEGRTKPDGDDWYCDYPGCYRRSDEEQPRPSCDCGEYDCAGMCCGGACTCNPTYEPTAEVA